MKIKKILSFGSITLASLLCTLFINFGHAFAVTKTWTGTSADYKLNTGGNWSGGSHPSSGDTLDFDTYTGTPNCPDGNGSFISNEVCLTNDLGVPVGGITGSGTNVHNVYSIDVLTATDGATLSSGANSIQIGNLTAQGGLTLGANVGANVITAVGAVNVTGNGWALALTAPSLTLDSGSDFVTDAPAIGGTFPLSLNTMTIQQGGEFDICGGPTTQSNIPFNITLGGGSGANPIISAEQCKGGGDEIPASGGIDLEGNITLLSDATINVSQNIASVDGSLTANGHTLTINLASTGVLKGNGTVGNVVNDGEISPGHSPGCLNTGNLSGDGTYVEEIGGTVACTLYDQTNVTGTVDLTGATLSTSLYGSFRPSVGQSYTIINNDGSDAVTGTFTGLPEDATFNVSGYVFQISYIGGDGNDVVLTVKSVPATPNTGFAILTNNPLASLAVTTLAAASILAIGHRYGKLGSKR